MKNFEISFDEDNISEIKINFPPEESEIIEMLFIIPLTNHFIEKEVLRKEGEVTLKCLPGKGEDTLSQMAKNMYSTFKVCKLPGNFVDNLSKIPEYMEEIKDKTWKELFDILENFEN